MPNSYLDQTFDFHGLTYTQPTEYLAQTIGYCGETINLINDNQAIQAQIDHIYARARICPQCSAYRVFPDLLCRDCGRIPFTNLRLEVRRAFMAAIHSASRETEPADLPEDVGVVEASIAAGPSGGLVTTSLARVRLISHRGVQLVPAEIIDSRQSDTSDAVFITLKINAVDLMR